MRSEAFLTNSSKRDSISFNTKSINIYNAGVIMLSLLSLLTRSLWSSVQTTLRSSLKLKIVWKGTSVLREKIISLILRNDRRDLSKMDQLILMISCLRCSPNLAVFVLTIWMSILVSHHIMKTFLSLLRSLFSEPSGSPWLTGLMSLLRLRYSSKRDVRKV